MYCRLYLFSYFNVITIRTATICLLRLNAAGAGGASTGEIDVDAAQPPIFLSASEAQFWTGPGNNKPSVISTKRQQSMGLLLLSANGFQVTYAALNNVDHGSTYQLTQSWSFSVPVTAMLTPAANCVNCIIYITNPVSEESSGLTGLNTGNSKTISKIVTSELGNAAMLTGALRREFALLEGESVLEMVWQPMPIGRKPTKIHLNPSVNTVDSTSWKAFQHGLWEGKSSSTMDSPELVDVFNPLLAVLTTNRVLIFTVYPVLQLLNSHSPLKKSPKLSDPAMMESNAQYVDRITSIAWVGTSVLYSHVSGRIGFLLPMSLLHDYLTTPCVALEQQQSGSHLTPAQQRHLSIEYQLSTLGLRPEDMDRGLLCSLPKHILTSELGRILAILPDRLIFACQDQPTDIASATTEGNIRRFVSTVNIIVRPLCPAEPLLMGLLLSNPGSIRLTTAVSSSNKEKALQFWADSVLDVVTQYFIAKQDSGAGNESGALPSAQATGRICMALVAAARIFLSSGSTTTDPSLTIDRKVIHNLLLSLAAAIAGACSLPTDARYQPNT